MHCGHCSYKLEPFLDVSLSLDIPLASPSETNHGTDSGTSSAEGLLDRKISESDTSKEPGNFFGIGSENGASVQSSPSKPRPKGRSKDDPLSLAQCLQHFTSLETLTEQVKYV
jgi:hypothetical protein